MLIDVCVRVCLCCTAEDNLNNPLQVDYKPACAGVFGGDCGLVFKSEYAHILSHWGLVPKDHWMDVSLAVSGIIM